MNTLDSTGARRETIRYSTYGVPFGMAASDVNGSGTITNGDRNAVNAQIGKSYGQAGYTVLLDIDLDGDVDINDWNIANGQFGVNLGHGVLSFDVTSANGGNRIGYAGYAWEPSTSKYAVRHCVFDPLRGRWSRRDPLGYVDSPTMYAYVNNAAMTMVDPRGRRAKPAITQGAECLPPNDNYHGDMQFKQVHTASPLGPEQTDPDPRNCQFSGGDGGNEEEPITWPPSCKIDSDCPHDKMKCGCTYNGGGGSIICCPLDNGESCRRNEQCKSGHCAAFKCASEKKECDDSRVTGCDCRSDEACAAGLKCYDGKCK